MRNEVMAVVVIVAVALAFAAGFTTATLNSRVGSTLSSTSSSTVIGTVCTIPDSGALILKILNSTTGQPIGSVPVQVQNLYPECSPNPHTTQDLGVLTTNANGTITTGGLGEFYLNVNYSGYYSVEAVIRLGETTCVTLGITSGEIRIWYAGYEPVPCQ